MTTPYVGPGIWIRIQHRFGPRMMEWFMGFHTAMLGAVLLSSDRLFDQAELAGFRALFSSEHLLGWIMLLLGILRTIGLVINGARKDVTPVIRQVSAGIGCLIWVGITYCYASSNLVSTWLAIYPLFAVGELVNINRAAHDQGETRYGKTG
ncbi:hypothetical protein FHX08_002090 [Rhizobium sp. BK529]|uniref:hypothetical protein n=1 Tax=Rhizobium sp. BK529 TaxID=2586983 RepID=UPI001614B822|nr:hypothetical protein [Rhizobium sp. BK529]MBB3591746.1 hypothetical protein [Rhizobium sp. BK529]